MVLEEYQKQGRYTRCASRLYPLFTDFAPGRAHDLSRNKNTMVVTPLCFYEGDLIGWAGLDHWNEVTINITDGWP